MPATTNHAISGASHPAIKEDLSVVAGARCGNTEGDILTFILMGRGVLSLARTDFWSLALMRCAPATHVMYTYDEIATKRKANMNSSGVCPWMIV